MHTKQLPNNLGCHSGVCLEVFHTLFFALSIPL